MSKIYFKIGFVLIPITNTKIPKIITCFTSLNNLNNDFYNSFFYY